jgi:hypothetical protein
MESTYIVYSAEQLAQLFDEQLAALAGAGVDNDVISKLRSWRGVVIHEAKDTAIQEGNLPFAPELCGAGPCYLFDVAPHPAGLLPASGRGSRTLAVRQPAEAARRAAAASDQPAIRCLDAVVVAAPRFVWHQRQALAAYCRDRDDASAGTIINVYA